jgi:nitrogen regulatory protein P-II 1
MKLCEKFIISQIDVVILKKIEAVVAHEKVFSVVDALKKIGVGGITIFDAKGWGKGIRSQLNIERGTGSYTAPFNVKNYVVTVVDDLMVDKVVTAIIDSAGTGSPGDGKIFIDTIENVIDIGSKQKGIHAI